jgi:hypothetical protein
MDAEAVSPWFAEYLNTFERCARAELDAAELLTFYGAPLVVTTDDQAMVLTDEDHVRQMAVQQVDSMRAVDYHHSDVLALELVTINATSDLYRGRFSRRRADGSEIARLAATYLAVDGPRGRRMTVLALDSA